MALGIPARGLASKGLFVADRSDASNVYPYQNGVSAGPIVSASSPVTPNNFVIGLGQGGPTAQRILQSAAFIGASLGAAGQLALYNRLRTYMSSVGVPAIETSPISPRRSPNTLIGRIGRP